MPRQSAYFPGHRLRKRLRRETGASGEVGVPGRTLHRNRARHRGTGSSFHSRGASVHVRRGADRAVLGGHRCGGDGSRTRGGPAELFREAARGACRRRSVLGSCHGCPSLFLSRVKVCLATRHQRQVSHLHSGRLRGSPLQELSDLLSCEHAATDTEVRTRFQQRRFYRLHTCRSAGFLLSLPAATVRTSDRLVDDRHAASRANPGDTVGQMTRLGSLYRMVSKGNRCR